MGKTWIGILAVAVILGSAGLAEAQNGLIGEYYNNAGTGASPPPPPGSPAGTTFTGAPALSRIDAVVDFGFANPPGTGVNADGFMVAWVGNLTITTAGVYTFQVRIDDGARLWIDGALIIDSWIDQSPTDVTGATAPNLTSGMHTIRLEFYENGGGEECRLRYSGPDNMDTMGIIPTGVLTPPPPPAVPGLTVVQGAGGINSAVATWTNSGAGVTYDLQRQQNGGGFTTIQTGLTGLTFTDPNLAYNSTYCYQVRAVQSALLTSAYSAPPDCVTILAPPPRVTDHSEGFFDDKCSCGSSTIRGPLGPGLAAFAVAALLWACRRR